MGFSFVHTSDWHLGFTQYNKPERFDDYFKAVHKTVKKIIEIRPDFVLHTGDIFHHPRPNPAAIRHAIIALQELKRSNIPFYAIRGNHDGKDSLFLDRGGGIVQLLQDLELLEFIDDRLVRFNDVNCEVLGIGYYPGKGVTKKLDQLLLENHLDDKVFSILALHAFVEGQIEEFAHVSLRAISDLGFDYIAAGHYHIPWRSDTNKIHAPGSSEMTAITDCNREDVINGVSLYSSFYEVQVSDQSTYEVKEHLVPVRPKIIVNHATSHTTIEQIRSELDDILEEKEDTILLTESSLAEMQPILSLNLTTNLEFEMNSQILVEDWYKDDFLHIISSINGKSNDTEVITELRTSHNIEEVFVDLIEDQDLEVEIYLPKLIDLKNEFGDHPPTRSLNNRTIRGLSKMLVGDNARILSKYPEEEVVNDKKKKENTKEETSLEEQNAEKADGDIAFAIEGTEDNQIGLDIFDDILNELE